MAAIPLLAQIINKPKYLLSQFISSIKLILRVDSIKTLSLLEFSVQQELQKSSIYGNSVRLDKWLPVDNGGPFKLNLLRVSPFAYLIISLLTASTIPTIKELVLYKKKLRLVLVYDHCDKFSNAYSKVAYMNVLDKKVLKHQPHLLVVFVRIFYAIWLSSYIRKKLKSHGELNAIIISLFIRYFTYFRLSLQHLNLDAVVIPEDQMPAHLALVASLEGIAKTVQLFRLTALVDWKPACNYSKIYCINSNQLRYQPGYCDQAITYDDRSTKVDLNSLDSWFCLEIIVFLPSRCISQDAIAQILNQIFIDVKFNLSIKLHPTHNPAEWSSFKYNVSCSVSLVPSYYTLQEAIHSKHIALTGNSASAHEASYYNIPVIYSNKIDSLPFDVYGCLSNPLVKHLDITKPLTMKTLSESFPSHFLNHEF